MLMKTTFIVMKSNFLHPTAGEQKHRGFLAVPEKIIHIKIHGTAVQF